MSGFTEYPEPNNTGGTFGQHREFMSAVRKLTQTNDRLNNNSTDQQQIKLLREISGNVKQQTALAVRSNVVRDAPVFRGRVPSNAAANAITGRVGRPTANDNNSYMPAFSSMLSSGRKTSMQQISLLQQSLAVANSLLDLTTKEGLETGLYQTVVKDSLAKIIKLMQEEEKNGSGFSFGRGGGRNGRKYNRDAKGRFSKAQGLLEEVEENAPIGGGVSAAANEAKTVAKSGSRFGRVGRVLGKGVKFLPKAATGILGGATELMGGPVMAAAAGGYGILDGASTVMNQKDKPFFGDDKTGILDSKAGGYGEAIGSGALSGAGIGAMFGPAGAGIGAGVGAAAGGLSALYADYHKEIGEVAASGWKSLSSGAVDAAKYVWNAIPSWKNVQSMVSGTSIGNLVAEVAGGITSLLKGIKDFIMSELPSMQEIKDFIKNGVTSAGGLIQSGVDAANNLQAKILGTPTGQSASASHPEAAPGVFGKLKNYVTGGEKTESTVSPTGPGGGLGALSEKFESGNNPGAIGNIAGDIGGISYGSYQLASNAGMVGSFMNHIKDSDPEAYKKLQAAGGDAAARQGTPEFTAAWKALAKDPKFAADQTDFMKKTQYDPAAQNIKNTTGLDVNARSQELQRVLFTQTDAMGVGGGRSNFKTAIAQLGGDPAKINDRDLIEKSFEDRKNHYQSLKAKKPHNWENLQKNLELEKQQALRDYDAEMKLKAEGKDPNKPGTGTMKPMDTNPAAPNQDNSQNVASAVNPNPGTSQAAQDANYNTSINSGASQSETSQMSGGKTKADRMADSAARQSITQSPPDSGSGMVNMDTIPMYVGDNGIIFVNGGAMT